MANTILENDAIIVKILTDGSRAFFYPITKDENIIVNETSTLDEKLSEVDASIDSLKKTATQSTDGLMSASDKSKLDGIETGANNYVHPTTSGNKHIPSGGSSGQILRWSADGTAVWGDDKDTTYNVFKGASDTTAGGIGLVPAPASGDQTKYLRADGTWDIPVNTTYGSAGSSLGLVKSGGDVTISSGVITVNDGSHNHIIDNIDGLQDALDGKSDSTHTHNYAGSSSAGGAANSAVKWQTARNINGMSVDGSSDRVNYGTCSTAAATAAKTVACSGFALVTGAEITVKFTVTNTASTPTLNVNGTGAKYIYYRGSAISAGYLAANRTYTFRYNGTQYELVGDINTDTTYSNATTSTAGLMSASDKSKLDGIETGANNYVHPTTSGNKHIPSGGSSGQILRWSADGTAVWGDDKDTTYSNATTSTAGLMSASDKSKLDGIESGANKTTVDTALSTTSTNPVQNKVIKSEIDKLSIKVDNIITDAPEAYDTLKEISDYIANHETEYEALLEISGNKVDKVTGKGLSTNDYTDMDKSKLDGIETGANNYVHPTTSGNKHIPSGGSSGKILRWSADGTAVWGDDKDTTYNVFKGASDTTAGGIGLVPAPASGDQTKYLRADGTWDIPVNTTYGSAGSSLGLVKSGGDVTISSGVITVNDGSHNHIIDNIDGLQDALDGKSDSTHTHNYAGSSSAGGAANSAVKWQTARNINGMSIDGSSDRVNYGTCSTAAATAAKTVACSGFALVTGAEITVKFTVTNTASNPTLNVNGTGAKSIYYRGSAISAGYLAANRTYTFRYNGTQYELVGDINTDTKYNNATSSSAGLMSASDKSKLDSINIVFSEVEPTVTADTLWFEILEVEAVS